ncbi:cyclic nucleotide-gated ion channel [Pannonibacter carbonis]|uniref:cyclic nucleotide-gated ion channel n=1 Tax=Pannonibacter carbonis TaxID=2067569 RepID=UPI000D0E9153|nr:cyclic nucleotide-gated ion channel [Pannonibacter carbonis]
MTSFKKRLYRLLEDGRENDHAARRVTRLLVALVLVTVAISVLETVPAIQASWGRHLSDVQLGLGFVFLAEYLCRLLVADLHPPLRRYGPVGSRLRYALQPMAIIDLLAILPLLLVFVLPVTALPALAVLRLLRFLKLLRYSPALRSLAAAMAGEKRALAASFLIVCGVILVASTLMYLVEHDEQPDVFGSIPLAAWWAVTTATTTGYGDVVPSTALGKMIAGLVMMTGYALLALPVGIIASAFAREVHSRDFVVTWSMVSRVPLFEDLKAGEVAEVAKLLRSHVVTAGELIAERGEAAHCMYFVASGEVEVTMPSGIVQLGEGAYFGEMALLRQRRHLATVRAVERTQLLVLDAASLKHLMRQNPELARRIQNEAQAREAWARQGGGDLTEEELHQPEALDLPPPHSVHVKDERPA